MRSLYSALLYLSLPLLLLRLLWRSRRTPAYRQRLGERFGRLPDGLQTGTRLIWVHAVSVGEAQAAAPLVEGLLRRYPDCQLLVTTTTPTGSERVRTLFGERVLHAYCPWDLPGSVRRFLRGLRPDLLLLMETELWPNLLHQAQAAGCRLALANARMSERSARGYARLGALTRSMLGQLDLVACQAEEDGERLLALGLPRRSLRLCGNLKYDLDIDDAARQRVSELRQSLGVPARPVLLAASTHAGEDEIVLAAFAALRARHPDCLLVLAPRHPERSAAVEALVLVAGWQVARHPGAGEPDPGTQVLLCDRMGELTALYGVATVAVIGGSLVPHGGHNPLEAAVWGVPAVAGPHMFNFAAIAATLEEAGAIIRVPEPGQLAACLGELLADRERRRTMGDAGRRVVAQNRGATEKLLELVDEVLADGPDFSTGC